MPLVAKVQPALTGIAVTAGTEALSQFGLFDKATLAKMTVRATAYARDRSAEMVGMKWVGDTLIENPESAWSITEVTRSRLRSLVTDAMKRGASNQELSKEIREAAAFSDDRAMMVARTESAMADTQGSIAGWKETGVVAGKQWLAAPDCCDLCQDYDGMIVGLDEEFPDGDVPLHPQCRCSLIGVLPEDMPETTDSNT